ncbi:MAG TPA: dialkylresorcinol condensing enzyme [Chromatiales bacterium]|nr:dialkylresorcinol condensing enzyme [Thiotrichales bacterium]HIP67261.1 dialkylresorcinol condensing enzyme [Chromatiales bacterium]
MKKILVIQYSQTGQLSDVVASICRPLQESKDVEVVIETLEPVKPYPYPWKFFEFLDVFPESVYLDPPELKPLTVSVDEDFDLVIFAYQVWFLSPSLPITAFLKSKAGKQLLENKPVVTVIACRDMWAMAQETVKKMLADMNVRLLDNIVLTDQGSSLASFITTPHWLFTGKKDAFWKFPPAGIADEEIQKACRFGLALLEGINNDCEKNNEPILSGLKVVTADTSLIKSEKIGYRSFRIWGKLIRKAGQPGDARRKPVLVIYIVFLVLMIVTVVPVNMLLKRILAKFSRQKQEAMKQYFEQPSGSGDERMNQFKCH